MADRYEIKGRLGRGGIGAVYQAIDHHLERDVAIKRLLPLDQTKLNESAEATLKSEAKALAALSHPNIVTIFEFGEDDKGPFVVFELIEGDTIKEVVRGGALTEVDFYEVADQMLDALISAKQLGLVHRDIKPANIMLSWLPSGKFQIKILDFGLSKFSKKPSKQTVDQQGAFLGSLDYIAPEQIELLPLDQRTDLYSLGCVLYYALTQRAPFNGANPAETMNNHLAGKSIPIKDLRPDLPDSVCNWVMRMISQYPGDRPDDAMAALNELNVAKQTISEPVPTAKVVIPVVEAQPTNTPRVLEYTQQIVNAPRPTLSSTIVPPHPNGPSDATGSTSLNTAATAAAKKSLSPKWAIMGLSGTLLLALIAGFVIFQGSRAESPRDTDSAGRNESLIPSYIDDEDELDMVEPVSKPSSMYVNSGRYVGLPPLPEIDRLIASYSVKGLVQDETGHPFDLENPTTLGALENMAPDAHAWHLLKIPDDTNRIPALTENWNGLTTLAFKAGQRMITPMRSFKKQQIVSDKFTFFLLYKLPENAAGTLFRLNLEDSEGSLRTKAIRMTYNKDSLFLLSEEMPDSVASKAEFRIYRVAIIEFDGVTSEVRIWQRPGRPSNAKLTGGEVLKTNLSGPFSIKQYEIGNLVLQKDKSKNKRVEIPAFAIYSSELSDASKRAVATQLMEGAFPNQ